MNNILTIFGDTNHQLEVNKFSLVLLDKTTLGEQRLHVVVPFIVTVSYSSLGCALSSSVFASTELPQDTDSTGEA